MGWECHREAGKREERGAMRSEIEQSCNPKKGLLINLEARLW